MDLKTQMYNVPSIFTILGGTGDLARRKIVAAFWQLYINNLLPEKLLVVGISRDNLTSENYRELLREIVGDHFKYNFDINTFNIFADHFLYIKGDFEDLETFENLKNNIIKTESAWGVCTNKLFYLAAQPSVYPVILENLSKVELNLPCGGEMGWSRLLIEKPFGRDLESALSLQDLLSKYFKEEQIYRIDHYLFKEIVQGIENFRFSNNLFEKNWNNKNIEKIEIKINETIGIEGRGSFYDSVGALSDVGQSHLLSMLSELVMEYPIRGSIKSIRDERYKILESLIPWTDASLKENTFRAQFEGYKNIDGVDSNSTKETYFKIKTEIASERWIGVPIYLEGGKKMGVSEKEIIVTFKHPQNCELCDGCSHKNNRIVFDMGEKNEINIHFMTKKPGFGFVVEERKMSYFLYEKENKSPYIEEYSKVIYDAIGGHQERFSSSEEVKAAWSFVDPIIEYWKNNSTTVIDYKPGVLPKNSLNDCDCKEEKEIKKEIVIIGLGKMGGNIAQNLLSKRWTVYGIDNNKSNTDSISEFGLKPLATLDELGNIKSEKIVWLMIPHNMVDVAINNITPFLSKGDVVIDGGNSYFKESVKRYERLQSIQVDFLDVGISGGPKGARNGACVMVGGDRDVYEKYTELFKDIACDYGLMYTGKSGSGHFVKMIHNGIEYGMMQSIGEGFQLLKESSYKIDVPAVAKLYNNGSVISSRLIGWLGNAYVKFGGELKSDKYCSPKVESSGEGKWTVEYARENVISTPAIESAVVFREESQKMPSYIGRILSALRYEFGGHESKDK